MHFLFVLLLCPLYESLKKQLQLKKKKETAYLRSGVTVFTREPKKTTTTTTIIIINDHLRRVVLSF